MPLPLAKSATTNLTCVPWLSMLSSTVLSSDQLVCLMEWTRGKTKIGGMVFHVALMYAYIVTRTPRSADVICPTCFVPVLAITLSGVRTVVIPDSSRL